jgi:hypothetical protein
MEVELDNLVKEMEKNVPMVVIPLNTVPITGVNTTMATSTTTGEILAVTSPDATDQLEKAMEDMTLQGEEIRKLQ